MLPELQRIRMGILEPQILRQLLVLRNSAGQVWLQRRPSAGIWAGMHCVPVFADGASLNGYVKFLGDASRISCNELQPFLHVLTHRDLHLHPVLVTGEVPDQPTEEGAWFGVNEWPSIGLPAPIRKLLDSTQAQLW